MRQAQQRRTTTCPGTIDKAVSPCVPLSTPCFYWLLCECFFQSLFHPVACCGPLFLAMPEPAHDLTQHLALYDVKFFKLSLRERS